MEGATHCIVDEGDEGAVQKPTADVGDLEVLDHSFARGYLARVFAQQYVLALQTGMLERDQKSETRELRSFPKVSMWNFLQSCRGFKV